MSQIYLQRFEYRGAIDRAVFDATWGIANEVMADAFDPATSEVS